jgi:simple sugar transport system permease protein
VTAVTAGADERVGHVGVLRRMLLKPEFGALIGAVVIFVFFAAQSDVFRSATGAANWLDVSSILGLMAVPVALLMIGGHFDLSAGVQVGTAGLATGIMTTYWGLQLYASWAVALALMLTIGFINGFLVTRTGLPSFIITLGMFLGLQGLNLGVTKQVTNTVQVGNLDLVPGYSALKNLLGSTVTIAGAEFPVAIIWWVGFTAVASWILLKTRFGNWIFATGGDPNSSKNVGVRTDRTTIALFMMTSFMAWFVGSTQIVRFGTIQAQSGIGQELYKHRRGSDRRMPAHRRLRVGGRRIARRADLRNDRSGHRQRRLELRLVQAVRRRDVAARRARQPVRPALRRAEQEVAGHDRRLRSE